MPDAGLPVRFGWFLVPAAADPKGLATEARLADGWVPSSPYVPPERLAAAQARIDDPAAPALREAVAAHRGRG